MTISVLNRTFKGLAELKLKRLSDDVLMNWPTPLNFVVDNNIEQKIQYTRTSQGERTRAGSYITGREPMLRVAFSHMQAELLAFKIGNYFEDKTQDLYFSKSLEVTQGTYPAVTGVGKLGLGVIADAVTQASVTRANASFPLVQTPFATFSAAAADTFAVGADFILKFSDNLVTARETVSMLVEHALTGIGIGDALVGAHSLLAHLITTENKLVVFYAPYVTPSMEGSSIDPSGDALEIPMFINTLPGECQPYEMLFTNQTVACR